jgi:pilus assembly protein CpaE
MSNLAYKIDPEPLRERPAGAVRIPHITLHAFCHAAETASALAVAFADRRMSCVNATVHTGGIAAARDLYQRAVSPNLVLIESRADLNELRTQLDALADVCQSNTQVVVIGAANDIGIYRELLALGVSEYIVAPINPFAVINTVARLYQDAGARKLGRTFAFVGAKGGVGSSTVANNVAAEIARLYGCDVVLMDLDLPFGTASLDFGLDSTQGIAQALEDPIRLDELLLERLLSSYGEHVRVLTAPAAVLQCYDLPQDALVRLIELAQARFPFVVLDIPHVWSAWAKKTLLSADQVVITASPDLANLRNAKNLIELLVAARPNDARPKLVLNQVGVPKRSELKPSKLAAVLEIEPTAALAFEPSLFSSAANTGKMIVDLSANSAAARSFTKIAETITGRTVCRRRMGFTRLWRR